MQIEPLMVSEEARASGVEMESCSWAFSIQFPIRFSIHLTKGANPAGGYLGAQLYLICVCILPKESKVGYLRPTVPQTEIQTVGAGHSVPARLAARVFSPFRQDVRQLGGMFG